MDNPNLFLIPVKVLRVYFPVLFNQFQPNKQTGQGTILWQDVDHQIAHKAVLCTMHTHSITHESHRTLFTSQNHNGYQDLSPLYVKWDSKLVVYCYIIYHTDCIVLPCTCIHLYCNNILPGQKQTHRSIIDRQVPTALIAEQTHPSMQFVSSHHWQAGRF